MGDKRKVKSKLAINNQSGFMNIKNKDTFFSNQFAFGGLKKADTAVKGFTDSIGFNPMSAIGGLGSSLVNSNGLSTGAGDIMGAVGGIASNIPGIGGVIGAGVQVLGGAVNAAFGSKMNKQFIQDTEQGIQDTSSTVFGGNDSNDLMDQYGDFNFMDNVSRSQVGKDGWFSSKAKKKTRRLNEQINKANVRANNSFGLGIENVATQNNLNASANYYAGGGFMDNILYDTSDQILHPMNNFKKKVEEVTPEFNIFDEEKAAQNRVTNYNIQAGDNLSTIASRHNTTLDNLLLDNPNITNPNSISIGDSIKIKDRTERPVIQTPFEKQYEYNTLNIQEQQKEILSSEPQSYKVKSGDNLSKIAKENNLTLQELLSLNKDISNPSSIMIGQNINLPDKQVSSQPNKGSFRGDHTMFVPMEDQYAWEDSLNSEQAITSYTNHEDDYIVIDKENKVIRTYDKDNKLLATKPIAGTGKSKQDYNSRTFANSKGGLIEDIGNFSTFAGPSKISSKTKYHNQPAFQRAVFNHSTGEYDIDSPSSIHYGTTDGSHACVRADKGTLNYLDSTVVIGKTMVHTLPEQDVAKYELRDGILNFKGGVNKEYVPLDEKTARLRKTGVLKRYEDKGLVSEKGAKYMADYQNVVDKKTSNPVIIQKDYYRKSSNTYKENVDKYAGSLMSNKKILQDAMGIDSRTYNELASLAMAIAEQETQFGTADSYYVKKALHATGLMEKAKEYKKRKNTTNHSYGYTQIKFKSDAPELVEIYKKLGLDEETLDTPEGSAIGTMAKLAWMFKFESSAPKRDDRPEPLSKTDIILYKYMGRGKEIKNNTATPSQNNYINSIKMYQKDTKILVPTKKRVTRAQASYNKEYIKDLKKNSRNGGIMGDYPNSKSFLDRFLN